MHVSIRLSFFFFFFGGGGGGGGCFLAFLCQQIGFVFSVCGCVHIYINKFVLVQALIIACAHWSSLTSVCVSVHNAWALNPLGHKFDYFNHINQEIRTKCVLNWNICYQVTVSDSSVAEGRLSVHAQTNKQHTPRLCICCYPRTVVPLRNTTRQSYRKNSKNWDTRNNYHNCPTIGTVGFYNAVLCSKDADRITNREDPDQTAPCGAV